MGDGIAAVWSMGISADIGKGDIISRGVEGVKPGGMTEVAAVTVGFAGRPEYDGCSGLVCGSTIDFSGITGAGCSQKSAMFP
jgi:hypothetical protein